jgi:sulfur carrier protein ThiS
MILTAGGYLDFYMPGRRRRLVLELAVPQSLRSVLTEVGIPIKEVQLILLNGKIVDIDETIVSNEDQIKVVSPIDGG